MCVCVCLRACAFASACVGACVLVHVSALADCVCSYACPPTCLQVPFGPLLNFLCRSIQLPVCHAAPVVPNADGPPRICGRFERDLLACQLNPANQTLVGTSEPRMPTNPQHVLLGTLKPGSACQQVLFGTPSTSFLELWNQVPHASKFLLEPPARPSWNVGTRIRMRAKFRMPASPFWNPPHPRSHGLAL